MKRVISLLATFIVPLWIIFSLSPALPQETPPAWQVYFSPKGGCTDAIIRELNKAKSTVLVQAYSFTSAPIAKALLDAHKRGVEVEVILDKSQRTDQYSSATFFYNSGIPVKIDSQHAQETYNVLWVVDGDTLKVLYQGKKESVRLIGIDTPETRVNPRAKKESQRTGQDLNTILAMGKESTKFVKTLVNQGDHIGIEFDVQKRDKYGRLLGYVYLPNGQMLNEEIVKAGYANLLTIPPNVKYQDRFLKAYREAREGRRGLWK